MMWERRVQVILNILLGYIFISAVAALFPLSRSAEVDEVRKSVLDCEYDYVTNNCKDPVEFTLEMCTITDLCRSALVWVHYIIAYPHYVLVEMQSWSLELLGAVAAYLLYLGGQWATNNTPFVRSPAPSPVPPEVEIGRGRGGGRGGRARGGRRARAGRRGI
jgi:hypothetical protein